MADPSLIPRADSLLGVAFAGADLVLEVDAAGVIGFALGAAESLTGASAETLRGRSWATLFGPDDGDLLDSLLLALGPGERIGPLRMSLAPTDPRDGFRPASLSVFRLPRKTSAPISCAISLGAAKVQSALAAPMGLASKDTFPALAADLLREAQSEGLSLRLDLVELKGLEAAASALGSGAGEKMRRQVAAALRADSYDGVGAAELAPDRFAVLSNPATSPQRLTQRLKALVGGTMEPTAVALTLASDSMAQNLRAMRFALDRYIEQGAEAAESGFAAVVKQTLTETAKFKTMLATGGFQLVYQPVITLPGRRLHHYEALARFDGGSSPGDAIRMAEELGLIVDFDLAVVRLVMQVLSKAPKDVKVAVNLSAVSLMKPGFPEALIKIAASTPTLRARMLLELTETHALEDLEKANRILQDLRALGHLISMDDFGAGAASLEYLRNLDVDFVKIDGRYVQSLTRGSRDEAILKHVVALCRQIGVNAIAEMVETTEVAELVADLGVSLGQGWLFGRATAELNYAPPPPIPARRTGERETWS